MRKSHFEKYLDAELLFRKYWEDGDKRSVVSLAEWASQEGMKSSRGGEPTPMGVWKALWRWASLKENKDLAYSIACANDLSMTLDKWKKRMIHIHIPSAWQHTDVKRYKFLRENGWI